MTSAISRRDLVRTAAVAILPVAPALALPAVAPRSVRFMLWNRPVRVRFFSADAPDDATEGLRGRWIDQADDDGQFVIEPCGIEDLPERPHPADVAPIVTELEPLMAGNRFGYVRREWAAEHADRCGLCKMGCAANVLHEDHKPTDRKFCWVTVPKDGRTSKDLALFRCDYPRQAAVDAGED